MLPDNDIKEYLSASHINAITSIAGAKAEMKFRDHGVDGSFRALTNPYGTRILDSSFSVDFQAKSTVNWTLKDDYVIYNLEVKTYNDMASRHSASYASPLILILLCLPKEKDKWVSISEDQLVMTKCCYWHMIKGPMTENKEKITIRIPCNNLFEPGIIKELLEKLERGEEI
ncbi:DUF4365 domain-containing protein [Methanococcoides seepicolus]|uniref:DUF4365 domain-containing protein n=1 Tax=Methanococcoides seepicolus TaxID=2828780 RepID=A0A9E4ZC25_9EURY|nr:DUF4365 domain-containing protein [Methanococcoides seepicolus]MCM1985593.1 DUF4365 domain-containing protein [Methanococcoides seepicolus]